MKYCKLQLVTQEEKHMTEILTRTEVSNLFKMPVRTIDYPVSAGQIPFNVINEPGLYSLIICSTKPEAKKFKRWIIHEVIPQIRKQGFYTLPGSHQYALNFINAEADAAIRMAKTFGFIFKAESV